MDDDHSKNERLESEAGKPKKRDFLSVFFALVDQGFVSLNNFVTFILVAKFGSRSDVNLYVLAWSIVNVLRVIQERGLAAPYFVFANEPDRDQRSFLGSSLVHQFAFSIISAAIFCLLALIFQAKVTPIGMVGCCLILAVSVPAILLRDHLRAICCAHSRYELAMALSCVAMALQIAIIYWAYTTGRMNVVVVFAAMGFSSLVPGLIWLLVQPQPLRFESSRYWSDWNATSEYSKWLVTARIFPSVAMGLVPWLSLIHI